VSGIDGCSKVIILTLHSASITSIARTVYIRELNTKSDLLCELASRARCHFTLLTSITDSASNCLLWSVTEEGTTIFAGCIACYRPLFVKVNRISIRHDDDGTRGRSGRPRQPFDTQLEWDAGLTIGTFGNRTNFSEDLPIQIPSEKHSSTDLHITNRSDSSVPFHIDTLVKEKGLCITMGNTKLASSHEEEIDRTSSDGESFDLTQLKRHHTTESESSDDASLRV